MKKALILHSWYGAAGNDWYPWLKRELEKKDYSVFLQDFPELRVDVPDMEVILTRIEKECPVDVETTVIGHSIGCLLALRLAERHKFQKMILVVGWDYDDLTEEHKLFWKTKIDHSIIKNNVQNIFVVHSDNDPYTTVFQAEEMSKRLNAKFVLIKGAGHFTKKDIGGQAPVILDVITK